MHTIAYCSPKKGVYYWSMQQMDESHTHNAVWKKPDIEKHMLNDFIYIRL